MNHWRKLTRAAIYARYSSEMQTEDSIEDQLRICRRLIADRGWELSKVYHDMGITGASLLRPGYQNLLEDARRGHIDVLVAESVDRLSRDQEHIAALHKMMCFLGIPIETVADGLISELHIGLKGTMSALYLKDLAQKTHRGLEGRVRKGMSAGGIAYDYRLQRTVREDGTFTTGERTIDQAEAQVINRIFRDYAAGHSRAPSQLLSMERVCRVPGAGSGARRQSTATRPAARASSTTNCTSGSLSGTGSAS